MPSPVALTLPAKERLTFPLMTIFPLAPAWLIYDAPLEFRKLIATKAYQHKDGRVAPSTTDGLGRLSGSTAMSISSPAGRPGSAVTAPMLIQVWMCPQGRRIPCLPQAGIALRVPKTQTFSSPRRDV